MTVFMKKTKPMFSPQRQAGHMVSDFAEEHLVTADQASAALNLPLYYFIDARKRAELGIPYYSINRMVRYRIRELHKWQVRYAAEQVKHPDASPAGGAHA
jgi:hypothetical protein